jgi:hypothetical protein
MDSQSLIKFLWIRQVVACLQRIFCSIVELLRKSPNRLACNKYATFRGSFCGNSVPLLKVTNLERIFELGASKAMNRKFPIQKPKFSTESKLRGITIKHGFSHLLLLQFLSQVYTGF